MMYLRAVWTPDGQDGVMGGIVSNTNNTVPGQDKMGTSHLIYYLLSSLIYYLYLMSYQYLLMYDLPRSKSGQLETGITACKGIRHFWYQTNDVTWSFPAIWWDYIGGNLRWSSSKSCIILDEINHDGWWMIIKTMKWAWQRMVTNCEPHIVYN